MQQAQLDYKDCGKPITEYKVITLPRGDEFSADTFVPVKFKKPAPQRGPRRKSDEQIHQEQVEMFKNNERKLEQVNAE